VLYQANTKKYIIDKDYIYLRCCPCLGTQYWIFQFSNLASNLYSIHVCNAYL